MRTFFKMLSITLPTMLQGCSGVDPKREDVLGEWRSFEGAVLELKSDGSFTGRELPGRIFWNIQMNEKKFEGRGTWEIKRGQSLWEVQLNFSKTSLDGMEDGFGTQILISGTNGILENKPPWYLFQWIEEEGGQRYKFERK